MKWIKAQFQHSVQDERPFFFLLTIVLIGVAIFSIFENPELQGSARWITMSVLLILHIGLYWFALVIEKYSKWVPVYIIVQGLLAFSITLIASNLAMIFCLYAALIGITIGLVHSLAGRIATVGFLIGLSFISYGIVIGWGVLQWWFIGIVPMTIFVVVYVVLYGKQTETRRQAEELLVELEKANLQLSEYAAQVEDLTLKNERQRMARELHDTLSQGLAGIILQMEAVDAHIRDEHIERALQVLAQTQQNARHTLAEARQAIGDLRRASEKTELGEWLQSKINSFTETTGIPCTVDTCEFLDIEEEQTNFVRSVVSEGLSNISRHSEADHAEVKITNDGEWLTITIMDDGCGFLPDEIPQGHYGLVGIKELTRLCGGKLEINSKTDQGTHLEVRVPTSNEENDR